VGRFRPAFVQYDLTFSEKFILTNKKKTPAEASIFLLHLKWNGSLKPF